MKTLGGKIVSFDVSLLAKLTLIGAGAGVDKITEIGAVCPMATAPLDISEIVPTFETVILAVVSAISGGALAWIVADPLDTPVTGTFTLA